MRRKSLTDFGWRIDYCEIFCCQITDHIGVNSTSYSRKNTASSRANIASSIRRNHSLRNTADQQAIT
ncbi:hypothetical protein CLOSTMETH_03818 [[Clostridium] methylpentosum DSM 5476]|uniref:Uncharacterized protein n=1 Tax=[Clostridium] methylpentosum DSM 5476 TaxID=537013 RepID=C0EIX2_9FIRM|nr:hypothetical protein CLOSTMETH_03818 [[Clostridium] methylpentosum DSM 5476]